MLPNLALPEDAIGGDSSQVEGGAKATVEAYDHADFRLIATGALESVDNEINSATGTITLRATFAHDDEALCPNQFFNAQLIVRALSNLTMASCCRDPTWRERGVRAPR